MFRILQPCPKTWADLPGDHRKRYCDHCGHHVYAVEAYSPEEQRALLSQRHQLCIADFAVPLPAPSRRTLFAMTFAATLRPLFAKTVDLRLRIVDVTGAGLKDAEIRALNARQALLARALTNATGEATLTGLPEGDQLQLTAHALGFKVERQFLRPAVVAGNVVTITLQVGSVGGAA